MSALNIEELYRRHRDELLRYFVRRTADVEVALDLWAQTFAHAVAGNGRFRGRSEEEAAAWLYGIARRELALFYRRGAVEQRALGRLRLERPPASPELLAQIERRVGIDEARAELAGALDGLTDALRQAVELRVVHELPYSEIAERLGTSEVAARARVSRGLGALAQSLERGATALEVGAR